LLPDAEALLHEAFEARADESPDAEALVAGEERLSRGELDGRANRLARRLRALGVGPEVRVAVCAERRADLIVALLAVLKAGGAYVPVDPAYPPERQALLLEDSQAALLLTQESLLGRLPAADGAPVICLDRDRADWEGESAGRLPRVASADALAYLIYTSGSTGRPKGVAIPHRPAVALLRWAAGVYDRETLDGVLAGTSVCFDLSIFEIFIPLGLGGRVILADNALALPTLPAAQEVRLINTVPSAIAELARSGGIPVSAQVINLAGEPLRAALVDRLHALPWVEAVYNLYGPSEDTTYSTWARMECGDELPPSIGRPLDGTRAYLLDSALQPAAAGEEGELYLAGAGLARGYLGRPEQTAERFLPDPFAGRDPGSRPGDRVYRTGDLARFRPDGQLDFLGRIDHQVKIRGFRIELGEIETALARHSEVADVIVVARAAPGSGEEVDEKVLVAYVVPAASARAESELVSALRAHLGAKLARHMVPAFFVLLPALPLTPNGKVDRKALPEPPPAAGAAAAGIAPAALRQPLADALAALWAEALGVPRVGPDDDFFALGGHSIIAVRLLGRIRETLGLDVPQRLLFEAPTVAALAARLAQGGGARPAIPQVQPLAPEEPRVASSAQVAMWLSARVHPDVAWYNIPLAFTLRGRLDPAALQAALTAVVQRHETLRTVFVERAGQPVPVVMPLDGEVPLPPLPIIDLESLPQPWLTAESLAAAAARQPLDPERGPLLRALLLRCGAAEHLFLVIVHHLAGDDWSTWVLSQELSELYTAAMTGRSAQLAALPVRYADYAAWQQARRATPEAEADLQFWLEHLGAPEPLDLPADRPRPPVLRPEGGWRVAPLADEAVARGLAALARRQGATLFMVLLAAFETFLLRVTGRTDPPVSAPVSGRRLPEVQGLIGLFTNILVWRVDAAGDPRFSAHLARVRAAVLAGTEHQDTPFDELIQRAVPERRLDHTPLSQVVLALQNTPPPPRELAPGLAQEMRELGNGAAKLELSVYVRETAAGLETSWEYASSRFDATTAARLAGSFGTLLAALAADAEQHLSALPLLAPAERHQLLVEWNDTAAAYPRESTLPALVAGWAAATPEAVALEQGERRLSYRDLDALAERLASRLRALGVAAEVPVALLMDRSPEVGVAILAVLKAGGFYVPLDPSHPAERTALLLADTGAPILLAHSRLLDRLPPHGARILRLDAGWEETLPAAAVPARRPAAAPESLAYVMFTSGTTGRPKGVGITHRGVIRLVRESGFGVSAAGAGMLQVSRFAFDASTLEIWGALANGGRLVFYPGDRPEPGELSEVLARTGVSNVFLSTALFHQMAEHHAGAFRTVRQLFTGGEAVAVQPVRKVLTESPGCAVINCYGPTESTVLIAAARQSAASDVGDVVPLGRPIGNSRAYLLNAALEPVPIGVAGQVCAGGDGVARGYLGRPDLTAERFLPDPWSPEPGGRLYATGDLARRRTDGSLEFLGRIDQQVKIRGFRIEPAEVEKALVAHPGVAAAAVLLRVRDGEKRLVACVVPRTPADPPDAPALRAFLKERLPEPMIPTAFARMDALPLTATDKVDLRALARVADAALAAEGGRGAVQAGLTAPRTEEERVMAGLWAEILHVPEVGAHDNFFELGGHSLLANRVISRVRESFGVDLTLRRFFETPTVAELAAGLAQARASAPPAAVTVEIQRQRPSRPPLSFAQHRLWLVEGLAPGVLNVPVHQRLIGSLTPPALAAAVAEIVRRHEALRTVFPAWQGEPYQEIHPAVSSPLLPLIDLAGLPAAARNRTAARLAEDESRRPFDLAHGPLLRTVLVRLAPAEHLLLVTFHHTVTDGESSEIFIRELLALHAAFAAGRPSPLAELPWQYADYALWQRRRLGSDTLDALLKDWRRRFDAELPVLRLPTDRPRPPRRTYRGGYRSRLLPAALAQAIRSLAAGCGATLFMTLLAAFQALLRAYAGQDVIVVGTPVSGRDRAEIEELIGFFVNTLVLPGNLSGDPTFQALVARTREMTLSAFAGQELPFEKLVEALQPERDPSRSPLFQVMFALQTVGPAPEAGGLTAAPYEELENGTAQFDLTLYLEDTPEGLIAGAELNRDLFDEATIDRLLRHYEELLTRVTADPEVRLSQLAVPPLIDRPAATEAAPEPPKDEPDARRSRLAARLAELTPAQREALERRRRGAG
jgi:amino acid adenylation domain-containing protein